MRCFGVSRGMSRLAALIATGWAMAVAGTAAADPPASTASARDAAPVVLPGPRAAPLTMRQAIDLFKRGNLALAAARYDLNAARADVIAAGVLPNPNLAANGTFLLQGAPQGGEQSYMFVVDQVIPIAGQVGLRKRVARGLETAAEKDFAAATWSLLSDLRSAYAQMQIAQARYRILAAGLADLDQVEAVIRERATAGANPRYDALRLQVERDALRGRLADAAVDLSDARTALAQAIGPGANPSALVVEDPIPEVPAAALELRTAVAQALANRPDIQALRARATAAITRVAQVRREYVPSPDVAVGYNLATNIPGDSSMRTGNSLYLGITIPLPIFDRGQGKIERAQSEASAAQVRADAAAYGVRLDVERSVAALGVRLDAWRRYRDLTAPQVEQLRTIAQTAYREGKGGILELLDAYRSYLEARDRGVTLQGAAWLAWIDVERVLGKAVS